MKNRRREKSPEPSRDDRLAIARTGDLLVQLAARADMARDGSPYYHDERFVSWLDAELNSPERAREGWSRERISEAAQRLRAKVEAARLSVRAVPGVPPADAPAISGTIPQVLEEASAVRAAPLLELSPAAGVGRDLWDEVCDTWVKVPDDVPAGQYVALPVRGESMSPLLHTGDTVLVRMGKTVARETVVLVRVPDAGYVVKRVGRVSRSRLELLSLDASFPPIVVPREEGTVVGTVVLRWCPHGN